MHDPCNEIKRAIKNLATASGYEFVTPDIFDAGKAKQICTVETGKQIHDLLNDLWKLANDNVPKEFLNYPTEFVLDEFCNCSVIDDIEKFMAANKGRNIRITLLTQSIEQMKELYGVDKCHTILACCGVQIFMVPFQLQHDENLNFMYQAMPMAVNKTESQYKSEFLYSKEFICRLPRGAEVISCNGSDPFIAETVDYSKLLKMHNVK